MTKAENSDNIKKTSDGGLTNNNGEEGKEKEGLQRKILKSKPLSTHWADLAAHKLLREKGDKALYTLASGITPSGTIHIGNFRELITSEIVARALKSLGKKVRYILSWDDYDVFRKVPKNFDDEKLTPMLGRAISNIPAPQSSCNGGSLDEQVAKQESASEESLTYARHNQLALEKAAEMLGVQPEYIYQNKRYKACTYAEDMRKAMQSRKTVASILNKHRENPLGENYTPLAVYCEKCEMQTTNITGYDEEYTVQYLCSHCQHDGELNFKIKGRAKLAWRIDWPMRWAYEEVDFEPGGKDHSSPGGSFDTGKEITAKVFGYTAPSFLHYDFVGIKGRGGKMSSSEGDVVTPNDLLHVYAPEIVRYFFTVVRSNMEFSIGLGEEVIAAYDVYDRLQQQFYGLIPFKKGQEEVARRVYQLSQIDETCTSEMPFMPAFRHLTSVLQIHSFSYEKVLHYYDTQRGHAVGYENNKWQEMLLQRAKLAENWLKTSAPSVFCFALRRSKATSESLLDVGVQNLGDYHSAREKLRTYMLAGLHENSASKNNALSEKEVQDEIYSLIKKHNLVNTDFFRFLYRVTIAKDEGPRLATFLCGLSKEDIAELL